MKINAGEEAVSVGSVLQAGGGSQQVYGKEKRGDGYMELQGKHKRKKGMDYSWGPGPWWHLSDRGGCIFVP